MENPLETRNTYLAATKCDQWHHIKRRRIKNNKFSIALLTSFTGIQNVTTPPDDASSTRQDVNHTPTTRISVTASSVDTEGEPEPDGMGIAHICKARLNATGLISSMQDIDEEELSASNNGSPDPSMSDTLQDAHDLLGSDNEDDEDVDYLFGDATSLDEKENNEFQPIPDDEELLGQQAHQERSAMPMRC
ncbi:hypothetical protein Hypma_009381 [Hypsizygus marmoreus]|uniref:Uncharacterized protein n=1 Tax=Hypsizygus marmoreus TaxID=39966 RepID=A0A369JWN4_HYPMA|nr:hypothetical protein Hypma_009381 [Hypsizygus marmoreus]